MDRHPNIGFYAGSFDPFQLGHLDIAVRAAGLMDRLVIGVGSNPDKHGGLFEPEERAAGIQETLNWHLLRYPSEGLAQVMDRIQVVCYATLVNEAADAHGARYLVRGLQASDDYGEEWDLAGVLCKTAPHLEFIHLMAKPAHIFERSKYVRQLAMFGSPDLEKFVAPTVARALRAKFTQ
jgi:pantetheine-phosphate adenylyltransferase